LAKTNYLILCNDAESQARIAQPHTKSIRLDRIGPSSNVNLEIEDICHKLVANLPSILTDLLEVATYVYCADQAASRGGSSDSNNGERWNRNLKFIIPVRNPDRWNQRELKAHLCSMLGFLSDDNYEFHFRKLKDPQSIQQYIKFADEEIRGDLEDVLLFSGGIDSLGGAVRESICNKRRVALVSHRSFSGISEKQKTLIGQLKGMSKLDSPPYHIPVWINKDSNLSKEFTQRTRSFLFSCLAATVSKMLNINGFKIYENGVTSFNLPISAQVIGAKATRSTHPKIIKDFTHFFELLFDSEFRIENPFLWYTKADVFGAIKDADCGELIRSSISCSHPFKKTKLNDHCGVCSQCIDRRLAAIAANAEEVDPEERYEKNILIDGLKDGDQITMVESYVRTMNEVEDMNESTFFQKYPEFNLSLGALEGKSSENAKNIFDLYKRHSKQAAGAIDLSIQKHASDIRKKVLPRNCLLSIVGASSNKEQPALIHSDDYTSVKYQEKQYSFTPTQAAIIKVLDKNHERGTPVVRQDFVLTEIDSDARRLRDIFRNSDAWGSLIIPGSKKGTFRLNL